MDKATALEKTNRKFTNLLDGKVLNGISVGHIIAYYESLLEDKPITVRKPMGNIESNFLEDEIDYMHGDTYSEMYGGL